MPPAAANFGIGSWIERRARIAPGQLTLVGDRSFTYAELAGRVRRLANGLRRLGVGCGDRVAWLGPNHPAFLEALFASGWWARHSRRSTTGWRPMGGEVVAAGVVLAPAARVTEAEILVFGRQHLAAHQVPMSVRLVNRLPRNSVGKLLRARLHALLPPASPT